MKDFAASLTKNCNNCEYINLTEEQQHRLAPGSPHICMKYGKRVFHRSSRPGYHGILFPCKECEEAEKRKTMEKGHCGRPEWADEEGCPMDNPNEEMKDCTGCAWHIETEGQE